MQKAKKLLLFTYLMGLMIIPLLTLTSCAPIDQAEVINDLLPNLWIFLAHIFATVVLLIICIWLVWRPTKNALAKRHDFIQKEIDDATNAKKDALKYLSEANDAKVKAFAEAKAIINNAEQQAYTRKEQIEEEAQINSKLIESKAQDDAARIKSNIQKNMNQQIIDLAFAASSALLKERVSKKDADEFVNEFIMAIQNKQEKK